MVRVKHRYLLVHILYPESPEANSKPPPLSKRPAPIPDVVHFHKPTPADLTPQLLARMIKDQIGLLYGDYGVGVTAGSLNGEFMPLCPLLTGYTFEIELWVPTICVIFNVFADLENMNVKPQ